MNADVEPGRGEETKAAGDGVAEQGILVDEIAGVERIEIDDVAIPDLERMEEEQLRLAAEISELRRVSAARERQLEAELKEALNKLAKREAELTEQEAQIASLVLECSGLREQLKQRTARGPDDAGDAPVPSRDREDVVARLKERLDERGHALTVARQQIATLSRDLSRLRSPDGASGEPTAGDGRSGDGGVGERIRRMLMRGREHGNAGHEVKPTPVLPGNEVPTVVMDSPPAGMTDTGMVVVELPLPSPVTVEALRRGAARLPAPPRAALRPEVIRRYLISLDPDDHRIYELSQPRVAVGRGGEADVQLPDATVSRLHAILMLEGGATVVEDASSTNGLFVNARRVTRAALKDGDTVTFGDARYQYRAGPALGQ